MRAQTSYEARVWDLFVRIMHWSLTVGFFVAYLTEDEAMPVHARRRSVLSYGIADRSMSQSHTAWPEGQGLSLTITRCHAPTSVQSSIFDSNQSPAGAPDWPFAIPHQFPYSAWQAVGDPARNGIIQEVILRIDRQRSGE